MRKLIKNFTTTFIIFWSMLQVSIMVFASITIPTSTSDFYVNDFANVFSTEETSRLMNNAITLSNDYDGIQVVTTTVKSLDGNTIEDYALEMYNQYGIGKNDMGILILLSTGDREIRVEVGKVMEAHINDAKAGRFIDDYAIPHLKENKFNEGLICLQEALISEIITCVNAEKSQSTGENVSSDTKITDTDFGAIILFILIIIATIALIAFIIFLIRRGKNRDRIRCYICQKFTFSKS